MATRDYVKRSTPPRRKPKGSKKASPSQGRGFPKWLFLIALTMAGLFGFGLYYLSVSTPPAPSPAAVSKPKAPKKENTLPPKPEESWSYIEELENKQVEVEAKEQQLSARPYLMQCGAYKSENQASERKAMIAFQGIESQVKASQGKKGMWYRVVLGPYPQKRKAERDRNLLRKAGIEPCAIWFWPE
ncbi:SPOR domain-containing protein [Veronia pacifica]|uniref:Cell division protein n=1 Tax=Veronia pacifica TaxID=1080227 RepID=A0A1C3EGP7_9GAMM|nr:SPOR domain-containing protein [Veronia pacifica]ODA32384.1 cell division protein [Veronia pacifica]